MGYQHEQVSWDNVTILLSDKSRANAHEGLPIFTDVTGHEFHSEPTAASPLAQTYVDLLLGGALEIDKRDDMPGNFSFTDEVIDTTFGWSRHWVNDRPNLFRPMVDSPMAFQVSSLSQKSRDGIDAHSIQFNFMNFMNMNFIPFTLMCCSAR